MIQRPLSAIATRVNVAKRNYDWVIGINHVQVEKGKNKICTISSVVVQWSSIFNFTCYVLVLKRVLLYFG